MFRGRELDLDRVCDRASDFVLQHQHILHVPVVRLGPDMPIIRRAYQLRGDTHALAGALDGTFNQGVDIQLTADVRDRLAAASESHRRCPRHDAKRADLREIGGDRLGHVVGELLLFGIAGECLERQDGERLDLCCRRMTQLQRKHPGDPEHDGHKRDSANGPSPCGWR